MPDVLFIKTSSLGDVIHHMPAVVDAGKARPETTFAWLVEEAFAPLVRLHPAVGHVIPVAWRRWRKSLYAPSTMSEITASLRAIRDLHFDDIVDTQGLLRSALIARAARGRRHGYDSSSIREPLASAFYDVRYHVSRDLHAVERNRALTGLALGYSPQGAPDFGLDRARFSRTGSGYGLLLHATARLEKLWPEEHWIALGKRLGRNAELRLLWGTDLERARSERIAAAIPGARSEERKPLDQVAALIAGAQFVIGVDTGLLHLAAALGVPLVAIFTGSRPGLTGPVGSGPIAVLGADGAPPAVDAVVDAVEKVVR
ncbi:MAG TPA: lipopolysaccharide heptosyltransferase I [Pseudolabrys sp.]|jgi:heptosyltransferase-1|nr:lipopolysaccharide heptosyltransferase I [Pseudolabrys sp.]